MSWLEVWITAAASEPGGGTWKTNPTNTERVAGRERERNQVLMTLSSH